MKLHIHKKKKFIIKNYIRIAILVIFEILFISQNPIEKVTACCDDKKASEEYMITLQAKETNMKETNYVVVIDPGHGGYDGGSMGNGLIEKDITLQLAKRVGEILEDKSITVIYTRDDDEWYWTNDNEEDLAYRVATSKENNANLFLSIHLNSSEPAISGFEIWTSFESEQSYQFASIIQKNLNRLAYTNDRGLKNQDAESLYVLRNNHAPSVLIELGFITSNKDMEYISTDEGKQHIANAIADAITEAIEQ